MFVHEEERSVFVPSVISPELIDAFCFKMPRRERTVSAGHGGFNDASDNATLQAEQQVAIKPRRSHRKTRNGCAECRRRHIRCDKHHPVCSNCSTAERSCSYSDPARYSFRTSTSVAGDEKDRAHQGRQQDKQKQKQQSQVHGKFRSSPPTNNEYIRHLDPEAPSLAVDPSFSTTDLILFHHAETAVDQAGIGPQGQLRQVVSIVVRHSLDASYLLDQVLALAAIHLSVHLSSASFPSVTTPESAITIPNTSLVSNLTPSGLRNHATELQNRAVASFNKLAPDATNSDDPDKAVTRFLFSSILSLHTLAETLLVLRAEDSHLNNFIDSFADCLNLHRGIRAATGKPMYKFLLQTKELSGMLETLNITSEIDWSQSPQGTECDPLRRVPESQDLSMATSDIYRAAVHSLQWSFDMYNGLSVQNAPHAASAFSVTAPAGYADLLRKCCPEALIILAYYGVLLHRCRQYWVFRDAGARMVIAIANNLGTYWHDALVWPLHVIESEID